MGAVHGRQVGAVLIAKLDRCTRSGRRPRLVDRHVQPPRGGTYQCSRVSGHQQRGRAPRGQRARGRGAVGAGSNRRAHVSSAPGAQAAGPRHRRGGALRVPVHRRAPGMAPGRAGNARGHHRAPPPPASHGPRWPTSSAPPGTAPAPAASGRARAPTRSTRRANASNGKPQRDGARGAGIEGRITGHSGRVGLAVELTRRGGPLQAASGYRPPGARRARRRPGAYPNELVSRRATAGAAPWPCRNPSHLPGRP